MGDGDDSYDLPALSIATVALVVLVRYALQSRMHSPT
jgi:hypothetical protein